MKLLASFILPMFLSHETANWDTAVANAVESGEAGNSEYDSYNLSACGQDEYWDTCGNPCKEANCMDRVA